MSKRRFRSSRLSLFILFLFFWGCNYKVPKDSHTFVKTLSNDPDQLNPVVSGSAYASDVIGYIFEQMIDLDNITLQPIPKLATDWEISEDHLRYTFHLRKDVRWHDGIPLTAEDVIYTYDQIKNPKVDSGGARNYFNDIVRAEKLDDHTVRFFLSQTYIGTLTTLGLMQIVPKHIFNDGQDFNSHPRNREPVGTGPFKFVEWKTGQRILLTRNETYWGKPYDFQKILFKIVPDDIVSFWMFKKGEIDYTTLTPLQWIRQTESENFVERFRKHKLFTRYAGYNYIGWNLEKPYFKDRRVRLAMAHLVNRDKLNEKLLFGLYHIITGPYHPESLNYNKSLKPITYDLEKAKRLLDEAGWKDTDEDGIRDKEGVPFRFQLLFGSGLLFYQQFVPIFRKDLEKAGIEVELRQLDFVTLARLMQTHEFDAYMAGWGRGAGEEDLFQIWHSSQIKGGHNFVSYSNAEVDHLLEKGRKEFDVEKRALLYRRVHEILYEDQGYLFMFTAPSLITRERRFQNVREYPGGFDFSEWVVGE